MYFKCKASSSKAIKKGTDVTVKQLHLELESRSSKRLTKDDFVRILTVIQRTREDEMRSVDRSIDRLIEVGMKHADRIYAVILSLVKCWIRFGDENEK